MYISKQTLTQWDEVRLRTFERKPLRKVHGSVQEKVNGEQGTIKKCASFTGHRLYYNDDSGKATMCSAFTKAG
jgi:hypothetical protein